MASEFQNLKETNQKIHENHAMRRKMEHYEQVVNFKYISFRGIWQYIATLFRLIAIVTVSVLIIAVAFFILAGIYLAAFQRDKGLDSQWIIFVNNLTADLLNPMWDGVSWLCNSFMSLLGQVFSWNETPQISDYITYENADKAQLFIRLGTVCVVYTFLIYTAYSICRYFYTIYEKHTRSDEYRIRQMELSGKYNDNRKWLEEESLVPKEYRTAGFVAVFMDYFKSKRTGSVRRAVNRLNHERRSVEHQQVLNERINKINEIMRSKRN